MSDDKPNGVKKNVDLFSLRHLYLSHLPSRLVVFIIPVALILMVLSSNSKWQFLLAFALVMTAIQACHYFYCQSKHEALLKKYGKEYLDILNPELEKIGLNGLVARYWNGLEPK